MTDYNWTAKFVDADGTVVAQATSKNKSEARNNAIELVKKYHKEHHVEGGPREDYRLYVLRDPP